MLVTCALIILGGIGFLVIREVCAKRFRWKKLSMHAKVVISMSIVLIIVGAVMLKFTENITWMAAVFPQYLSENRGIFHLPAGNLFPVRTSGAGQC